MEAEDPRPSLATALDGIQRKSNGQTPKTCLWWADASPEDRDAVVRNVKRVGHYAVGNEMRKRGDGVTVIGIRDHVAETCPCQS